MYHLASGSVTVIREVCKIVDGMLVDGEVGWS